MNHPGSNTDPAVGPGTYQPKVLIDGQPATIADTVSERVSVHGESASVVSDSARNLFSWLLGETHVEHRSIDTAFSC